MSERAEGASSTRNWPRRSSVCNGCAPNWLVKVMVELYNKAQIDVLIRMNG